MHVLTKHNPKRALYKVIKYKPTKQTETKNHRRIPNKQMPLTKRGIVT